MQKKILTKQVMIILCLTFLVLMVTVFNNCTNSLSGDDSNKVKIDASAEFGEVSSTEVEPFFMGKDGNLLLDIDLKLSGGTIRIKIDSGSSNLFDESYSETINISKNIYCEKEDYTCTIILEDALDGYLKIKGTIDE